MNSSNAKHGWLNIDKPQGLSSSNVVTIIRKLLSVKKVGHAGTLDPMATGVLPIAIGEATKTVRFIQGNVKEYEFTVEFGSSTDSFDKLGQITATTSNIPSQQQILDAIPSFLGDIVQTPPIYAAIKIDGVRAYKKARAGEKPIMPSRNIRIDKLELLSFNDRSAQFCTQCSKGTYIRSLAHDLAIKVGSLGHVTALRRTMVGGFDQNNIISIEDLKEMVYAGDVRLFSIESALSGIRFIEVSADIAKSIRNGVSVKISADTSADLQEGEVFAKVGPTLIAIGTLKSEIFIPGRCFNFN